MSKSWAALREDACAGYAAQPGEANPHLWSSPAWLAFEAGRAVNASGLLAVVGARMGRGYSVTVRTTVSDYRIRFVGTELTPSKPERINA